MSLCKETPFSDIRLASYASHKSITELSKQPSAWDEGTNYFLAFS